MNLKAALFIAALIITDFVLIFWLVIGGHSSPILHPQGLIAEKQRDLIITSVLIMLIGAIPVLLMVFFVAGKYHANNTKAAYHPDWDHDHTLQAFFWGFLFLVIAVLCVINWQTAHQLDPFKPIVTQAKPLRIQVVALRWKWLFIYPEQGIATVNMVEFPEKTPINFELTADAPLNSFWIPQLGGQIYAMPGMSTRLHLIANKTGEFAGSTAELSGAGFAGMRFTAKAVAEKDFDAWVKTVKQSPNVLDLTTYTSLAKPSEDTPPAVYSSTADDLYTTIVMKFMKPSSESNAMTHISEMEMPMHEMHQ